MVPPGSSATDQPRHNKLTHVDERAPLSFRDPPVQCRTGLLACSCSPSRSRHQVSSEFFASRIRVAPYGNWWGVEQICALAPAVDLGQSRSGFELLMD